MRPMNIILVTLGILAMISALFNFEKEYAFSAACGWFAFVLEVFNKENDRVV